MNVVGNMRDSDGSHANHQMNKLLDKFGSSSSCLRNQVFPAHGELLIQWGFKPTTSLLTCIAARQPFVILDLGYFEPTRYQNFSVSINGFHGLSMRPDFVDGLKARPHPPVQPWKEDGENIIMLGQLDGDQSLRGKDVTPLLHREACRVQDIYHKPVIKRPHPKMLNPWEPQPVPLEDTFDSTYLYVTYNSTASVQTILAGCRTIALHPGCPAYEMCGKDGAVRMPGREGWVKRLSHAEYNFSDELDIERCANYITKAFPQARDEAEAGNVDTEGLPL